MAAYTTIDNPELYMQVKLYTGNGSANHAITLDASEDMAVDAVWIKNRDAADSHCVFDVARGATKVLHADSSGVEATDTDTLDSFTSDGFQVDADVKVNTNTEDYVAWCWNTQGGAGSSNTEGTINTTTTSVNTTSGFSISTYTGTGSAATIGHGLGAVPKFGIFKSRDVVHGWQVYHIGMGNTKTMYLESSNAEGASTSYFNDTSPTSTLMTMGNSTDINQSTTTYVGYIWAEVQGFSSFNSYIGNGNADGPFVYTGFKPAFIILKRTASSNNWQLGDNKRTPNNPANIFLFPDTSGAEESFTLYDSLSNGFKIRSSTSAINTSGETFIYMAFAEAPFVNSNGVPCNAR